MNTITLNIISNSAKTLKVGGPNKVLQNTIKGLDLIQQPYVFNQPIGKYKMNWVHDSLPGLVEVAVYKTPAVVGPNLVVLPKDLPAFLPSLSHCLYLHPSAWCVNVWEELNYKKSKLETWPAGIDIDEFSINRSESKNVMVYFKRRSRALLEEVLATVKNMGFNPILIEYGSYSEKEFKEVLAKCWFGIWLGITESQGIALQEALASNMPLVVCNVSSLFEATGKYDYRFPKKLRSFKPTSAPYFDATCGIIIYELNELMEAINLMVKNYKDFHPQLYIRNNLSLELSAKKLMSFFDILESRNENYSINGFLLKIQFKAIITANYLHRKYKAGVNILFS